MRKIPVGVSAHQRAVSSSSVGESDIEDPSMKKRGFARKSSTVLGGRCDIDSAESTSILAVMPRLWIV